MEETISSYELELPRSLVTLTGELHPGDKEEEKEVKNKGEEKEV